jgi:hypothetical protein
MAARVKPIQGFETSSEGCNSPSPQPHCIQEQSARLFLHCLKLMEVELAEFRLLHGEVIVRLMHSLSRSERGEREEREDCFSDQHTLTVEERERSERGEGGLFF